MKKTLAAISASVLGVGAAAIAGAAPASAATITTKCNDATDHQVNTAVTTADNWYMACIPQYGMGKAEFTITTPAATPFPAGYSLADGHQTVTSTPSAATVKAYFDPEYETTAPTSPAIYTGAFVDLTKDTASATALSQKYTTDVASPHLMTAAFPITSVGQTSSLPADCTPDGSGATYQGEYVVNYGTTSVHFSEEIKNTVYSSTIVYTPKPLYIGVNFDPDNPGQFDGSMPICLSSGGLTTFAANNATVDWQVDAFNATTFAGTLESLNPASGTLPTDGTDPLGPTTTDFGSFVTVATPVLATTGVDPTPAGLFGGGLLLSGILSVTVAALRRRVRLRTR